MMPRFRIENRFLVEICRRLREIKPLFELHLIRLFGVIFFSAHECERFLDHFIQEVAAGSAKELGPPFAPVEVLQLVGKYDAVYERIRWDLDFSRVVFLLSRYGAEDDQPYDSIVLIR